MPSPDVVIIGYDAVSPLGTDFAHQWRRAKAGDSGVTKLTRFAVTDDFPVQAAGQVPAMDTKPYPFLSNRALAQWWSPVFQHALLVVHRALEKSAVTITDELSPRVAVTFSSAVGGQDALLAADRHMTATGRMPHPFTNPNSCINMVGGKVAILTGATGPIVSTITACATGLTSILTGALLLQSGRADVAICGAVDFALVEPIVAGFATMNAAYHPGQGRPHDPPEKCSRPFSVNRRGFVISEGAGAVIITTRDFARARGLAYRIGIPGWSMTADAHHFVAPFLPTVTRCIEESIRDAGIQAGDIDGINAHAASTRVGDDIEYQALKRVFGNAIPPVSANKSQIGHAMGASSVIETIFALEGMLDRVLLPTLNYEPDPSIEIDCVGEGPRTANQEFVLKNAFGFGGCNACAVLQRME